MKLKILFFPLVLAAAVSVFISFVWPEISDARRLSVENAKVSAKIALIEEKRDIVRKLDQDLGKNSDKEVFIKSYLPEGRNEEWIINSISRLAVSSGVALAGISIEDDKNKTVSALDDVDLTSQKIFNPSSGEIGLSGQTASIKRIPTVITLAGG